MINPEKIPTIEPSLTDGFHFGKVQWQWRIPAQHHLFHINRLEDYLDKLSFPLPPHRKTIFDLLFLTKGSSIRSKGLNQYQIEPGQFFFLPALQITSHESMSPDTEGFFLHFSPDLFSDFPYILSPFSFLNFLSNPIVSIPQEEQTPILNIFYRLERINKDLKQKDLELVKWYLLTLLTEVNRFAMSEPTSTKENAAARLTAEYKDALSQHIYQHQSVRDYAEMLHVTPNHLNKCVKRIVNKTAQKLLNEMLILEAKSLLKYSGLPISQIAEKLCGQTPSNFTRFFKSQTGLSPKQFLELHSPGQSR